MSKNLIAVHCSPRHIVCDRCDDTPFTEVTKYYRIAEPKDYFESMRKYLECCKDSVGNVIDWEEEQR